MKRIVAPSRKDLRVVWALVAILLFFAPAPGRAGDITSLGTITSAFTRETDVELAGDYAYITACCEGGLYIFNVEQPWAPTFSGYVPTGGAGEAVAVAGHYAYVAALEAGLRVINVSTPTDPTAVTSLPTTGWAMDVKVVGSHAYVADLDEGLLVINLMSPGAPFIEGMYNDEDEDGAVSVTVVGELAYVIDGFSDLWIINVSDPKSPSEVGSLETGRNGVELAVDGNHVYMADGNSDDPGLWVYNVSNPRSPFEVTFFPTGVGEDADSLSGIAVRDGLAYLGAESGLRVVDISTPAEPRQVDSFGISPGAGGVALVGDTEVGDVAYVGLEILRLPEPGAGVMQVVGIACLLGLRRRRGNGRLGGVSGCASSLLDTAA